MKSLCVHSFLVCLPIIFTASFFPDGFRSRPTSWLHPKPTADQIPAVPFFSFPDEKQAENTKPRLWPNPRHTGHSARTAVYKPLQPHWRPCACFRRQDSLIWLRRIYARRLLCHPSQAILQVPPEYYRSQETVRIFEVDLTGYLNANSSPQRRQRLKSP